MATETPCCDTECKGEPYPPCKEESVDPDISAVCNTQNLIMVCLNESKNPDLLESSLYLLTTLPNMKTLVKKAFKSPIILNSRIAYLSAVMTEMICNLDIGDPMRYFRLIMKYGGRLDQYSECTIDSAASVVLNNADINKKMCIADFLTMVDNPDHISKIFHKFMFQLPHVNVALTWLLSKGYGVININEHNGRQAAIEDRDETIEYLEMEHQKKIEELEEKETKTANQIAQLNEQVEQLKQQNASLTEQNKLLKRQFVEIKSVVDDVDIKYIKYSNILPSEQLMKEEILDENSNLCYYLEQCKNEITKLKKYNHKCCHKCCD